MAQIQKTIDSDIMAQNTAPPTVRAYESVAVKIRQLIEKDNLGPGDMLPPERQLAEKFKVSRHSLREAIRVLQEQGVLAARQGSGNYIQAASQSDLVRALGFSAQGNSRKLVDLFQLREMLEPQIAKLATTTATDDQIASIAQLAKRVEDAEDFKEGQKCDQQFHEAIAAATGNQLLFNVLQEINKSMLPTASSADERARRDSVSTSGHRRIVAALEARDGDAAEDAMRQHIAEIRSEVI